MDILALFGSILLGLIIGSFLSMLIPRLHDEKPGIVKGRSQCPHCGHILGFMDLIPLFSYVFLRGRCRYCDRSIAFWYPFTELSTALLFGALYAYTNDPSYFLWLAPLFTVLIFIFIYDLRYKEIHDAVMLPGIVWAVLASWNKGDLRMSLIGAAIGLSFFGLQYLLSRGRWIGAGDLRIGVFIGLLLGWKGTLVALFFSYVLGSIFGIGLLISKRANANTAVPLGPFLVLGTLLTFFWGDQILQFYLSL